MSANMNTLEQLYRDYAAACQHHMAATLRLKRAHAEATESHKGLMTALSEHARAALEEVNALAETDPVSAVQLLQGHVDTIKPLIPLDTTNCCQNKCRGNPNYNQCYLTCIQNNQCDPM